MPEETHKEPQDSSEQSAAPSFITQEQLNQALNPFMQAMDTMKSSMEALAAARNSDSQVRTAPTPINIPTDAEILEEIQAGGITKLKQIIKGAVDEVRDKELRPFQQQGMQMLATQAEQLAKMSGNMPHYDRFKKQIDTVLKSLPADQRTNAEVYKTVHDMVVGQNLSTLLQEKEEATVRSYREKNDTSLPGGAGGRQPSGESKADGVPSFEEHFGKEGLASLKSTKNHETPDSWCQKMGYKDWPDYYTKAIKVGA